MSSIRIASRSIKAATVLAMSFLLCGFSFRADGPPEAHYADYNAKPPVGNTVSVCHAHGCQEQDLFTFSQADISDIAVLMDTVRAGDTAEGERQAIAYAIAWMERRVGPVTGTDKDRASLGFFNASGQLDCVDEATNSTSYLLVLQRNGLLRHYRVIRPYSKASFFQWPHFAAMIQERQTGTIYAIDSGVGPNGTNPSIMKASEWYINDNGGSAAVPNPTRMTDTQSTRRSPSPQPDQDLGLLVQRILRDQ